MSAAQLSLPAVGQPAPDFRLPSAQGGEVGLADFLGSRRLVVWFSRGLFCPFCRRYMVQLAQGYARLQALEAEVLQVTHSTAEEARRYFRSYTIVMPYLCDPDRTVHERYGIPLERQGVGAATHNVLSSMHTAATDLLLRGERTALPLPHARRYGLRSQSPQVVMLLDKSGRVRRTFTEGRSAPLPNVTQLAEALETVN